MAILSTRRVIRIGNEIKFFGELDAAYWEERGRWMEAKAYRAKSEKQATEYAIKAAHCFARANVIKDMDSILERETIATQLMVENHPLVIGTKEAEEELGLYFL